MGLSSIAVKWEPVPQGSRNGPLIGYRLEYRQIFNNGSDGEVKFILLGKLAAEATLMKLDEASVYRIEVAGVTVAGIGVYSKPITAKTGKSKTA